MNDQEFKATGGCMCDKVRYQVTGKPFSVSYCHCLSCRRHSGAPVVTLVGLKQDQVEFTEGERKIYESSPGVGRGFCGDCGTPISWEGDGGELGPLVELHINTFDDPNQFPPEQHIHHDERLSWFDTADELPRFHEWDEGEPYCHGPVVKKAE